MSPCPHIHLLITQSGGGTQKTHLFSRDFHSQTIKGRGRGCGRQISRQLIPNSSIYSLHSLVIAGEQTRREATCFLTFWKFLISFLCKKYDEQAQNCQTGGEVSYTHALLHLLDTLLRIVSPLKRKPIQLLTHLIHEYNSLICVLTASPHMRCGLTGRNMSLSTLWFRDLKMSRWISRMIKWFYGE